jgi:hypothetical protein
MKRASPGCQHRESQRACAGTGRLRVRLTERALNLKQRASAAPSSLSERASETGDECASGRSSLRVATVRRVVENAISWLLMNKRLDRGHDRSSLILQALLTTACTFIAAKSLSQ